MTKSLAQWRGRGKASPGSAAHDLEDLAPAEIRPQTAEHDDGAVGLLVVLEDRGDEAGRAERLPVEVTTRAQSVHSVRSRMFSRRAWNWVVFEVEVSSR